MDENNSDKTKRGRYKGYVTNPDIPIPRTTKIGQSKRNQRDKVHIIILALICIEIESTSCSYYLFFLL